MSRREFLVATAGLAAACAGRGTPADWRRTGDHAGASGLAVAAGAGRCRRPGPFRRVPRGDAGRRRGARRGRVDPAIEAPAALSVPSASSSTAALSPALGRGTRRLRRAGRRLVAVEAMRRCWRGSGWRSTACCRQLRRARRGGGRRAAASPRQGRRWTPAASRDHRHVCRRRGDGADAPAAVHIGHGAGAAPAGPSTWPATSRASARATPSGRQRRDAFPPQQLVDA